MSFFERPQVAPQMPMDQLMRMLGEVEEIADGGAVTAEAMGDLGSDLGVPAEKLYAGLGLSESVTLKLESDVQFLVCTGGCQQQGALACLSELLNIREDRIESGEPSFDVVPRPCLNRCQVAPVIELRSPQGNAVLTKATPNSVAEAVEEIFGE